MSLRPSSGFPRICSGLMNSGVPSTMPVAVSLDISAPVRRSFASPKSITTARNACFLRHQHDVLGLEVPMDDLELVGVLEAVAHLDQQRDALLGRERAAAGLVLAQRLAFEVGHHQIEQPVRRLAQAEDGADVGMVEPHGDRRFAPEPLDRGRIAGEPRHQDLHRHRAARIQLLRPVDVRHAALAEPAPDPVAPVEQLAAERRQRVRRAVSGSSRLRRVGWRLGAPPVPPLSPPPLPPPARFRR